jgi:8-oxo-dGTP pyrophosphatase MutT (NUDIX family)
MNGDDVFAVVVLIEKNDKVLGVSRKHDHTKFGLPGGKKEPGENIFQCAARELKEETGISACKNDFTIIFSQKDDINVVTMHLNSSLINENDHFLTEENIMIKWVSWETLLDGPFGKYNKALYDFLKNKKMMECQ